MCQTDYTRWYWYVVSYRRYNRVVYHEEIFLRVKTRCIHRKCLYSAREFYLSKTRCFWYTLSLYRENPRQCRSIVMCYPNGPEAGREAGWGSEFVPLKKRQAGSFILLHKISRTACCFGIRTFLKQYSCYESATNWYTDHQYLAQYSDIINNLQEIPLIFCNYAVRSCGTWRKGPGQSPCNGLSISDLELYVTARVFVTPVTD